MNLRCFYCQTPFTLSTEEKITALRKMHAEDLHHYDAHCPRCGRANPVSRERLEMFTPGWEAAIKTPAMEAGAAAGSAPAMPAAPAPSFSSTPGLTKVEPKTLPLTAAKKEPAKKAPARRKHATAAKKATRKTAAAPKRKPAVKKAAAKKKTVAKAKPKKSAAKAKARKPAKSKAKARKKK
jgi:hypothetical protein